MLTTSRDVHTPIPLWSGHPNLHSGVPLDSGSHGAGHALLEAVEGFLGITLRQTRTAQGLGQAWTVCHFIGGARWIDVLGHPCIRGMQSLPIGRLAIGFDVIVKALREIVQLFLRGGEPTMVIVPVPRDEAWVRVWPRHGSRENHRAMCCLHKALVLQSRLDLLNARQAFFITGLYVVV